MSTLSASATTANEGLGLPRVRKMTVVPMIAATYFMVAGGPYGLEDIVQKTGYAATLLILLITPLALEHSDRDDGQRTRDLDSRRRRLLHLGAPRDGPLHGLSGNVAHAWRAACLKWRCIRTCSSPTSDGSRRDMVAGHRGSGDWIRDDRVCAAWNIFGSRAVGDGSVLLNIALLAPFALLIVFAVSHGTLAPSERARFRCATRIFWAEF